MCNSFDWLPAIIPLSAYGGDWKTYEEALYAIFSKDFVRSIPRWDGQLIRTKYHPSDNGKHYTFWHMICEGPDEEQRTPDLRRCERLPWPRPIIDHYSEDGILVWENERRRGERRVCIWMKSERYLIVLARRNGYLVLWTTYVTDREHTCRKLQKEHDDYQARLAKS